MRQPPRPKAVKRKCATPEGDGWIALQTNSLVCVEGEVHRDSPAYHEAFQMSGARGPLFKGPIKVRCCGQMVIKASMPIWVQGHPEPLPCLSPPFPPRAVRPTVMQGGSPSQQSPRQSCSASRTNQEEKRDPLQVANRILPLPLPLSLPVVEPPHEVAESDKENA